MKKNGFTLVEVLAVLIILGLLIVLSVPAYLSIYNGIRRKSYNNKIELVEDAMLKYGYTIKDEIKYAYDENKGTNNECLKYSVEDLIELGYLESESDTENILINPTTNSKMYYDVYACYCPKVYDIRAYYAKAFVKGETVYEGERVIYDGEIYEAVETYPASYLKKDSKGKITNKKDSIYMEADNGIASTYKVYGRNYAAVSFFKKVNCAK